jgi:hypothetical protein
VSTESREYSQRTADTGRCTPVRWSTCSPIPGHAARVGQPCGATSARALFQVPVESNRNLDKSRASANQFGVNASNLT